MDILLASGNRHKHQELSHILKPHRVLLPQDLKLDFHCEETCKTYMDNALLKAQTLHEISGLPVLADDSGLSVPALGGAPGIYSARYGQEELGRSLSSTEQNDFLLKNMAAMEDRQAFFVCAMALFWEPYRFITAQEILKGEIASSPSGAGGFGYDPVFYLPEYKCCLAEISTEEKNEISHRGKAARVISSFLD